MKAKIVNNIIFLLFSLSVFSQPEFKHYGMGDGFSDISVRKIIQDDKGFLWFGTLNGLNRFDGKNVKIYRKETGNPNSLENNKIASLYQDSLNYIWILTYDRGIHRFNPNNEIFENINTISEKQTGKKSVTYDRYESSKGVIWIYSRVTGVSRVIEDKHSNDLNISFFDESNQLPDNTVRFVHKDKTGVLWIGTSGGLVSLENDRVLYSDTSKINKYLDAEEGTEVICFMEDENNIWFGTADKGLYYFSFKNKTFNRWSPGLINSRITQITKGIDNSFLISTQGQGLVYIEKGGEKFTHLKPGSTRGDLVESQYFNSYHDQYNKFWIQSHQRGVTSFDPDAREIKYYGLNPQKRESVGESDSQIFFEDSNGDFWIGIYGGGLCKLKRDKMEFEQYYHISNNPLSLSSNYIVTIFEDDSRNMWIGTYQGGINKLELYDYPFDFIAPVKNTNMVSSNEVRALMVDSYNRIWIGTKAGMVYCYDQNYELIFEIPNDIGLSSNYLKSNVYELKEDSKGNLWIGTKGQGVYLIRDLFDSENLVKNKYKVENYQRNFSDQNDPKSLSSNDVYAIHEDVFGQIWIGTFGYGGLNLIENAENITIEKIKEGPDDKINSLKDDRIRYIAEDSGNNLWIGTLNGISLLEKKYLKSENRVFKEIDLHIDDSTSLLSYDIITILEDSKKRIWAGTYGGGIGIIVPDSEKGGYIFDNITLKNGLPSEVVVAMLEDENENIWVGTDNGICKINYDKDQYENYVKEEGIGSNLFSEGAGVRTRDGKFIYGLKNGFVCFYPDQVIKDTLSYNLWITGIKILNKTPEIGADNSPLTKSIELTKEITLKYDQNFIEFGFSLLDYFNTERCQYKYRLKGLNDEWFNSGTTRNAVYTDLDPGEYEFQVKAANHDGFWIENIKSIRIIIKPPFYKTIFFKILIAVLVLTLVFSIYAARVSGLRKQKIYLEKQVKERTYEIGEKNKVLIQQTEELNKSNRLLADRQTYIEKQADELKLQKEKLEQTNDDLSNTNTLLEERQQQIEEQSEELKVQAEELSKKNADLLSTNATKDKLFSIIAHDLKNPFNSILGFCKIILTKYDGMSRDKVKHLVEIIYGSTKNIYSLLDNLLQWSRTQTGSIKFNPEKIALYDIIDENKVLVQNMLKQKNIEFQLDVPRDISVFADQNMINTVVRNLITNSIKFTENGKITVSAEQSNGNVSIEVTDNGRGIPEEKIDKLFIVEKSKSTEGTRGEQGSGLGLIICKEFIEKNGGKISVKSKEGQGARFTFNLPLAT